MSGIAIGITFIFIIAVTDDEIEIIVTSQSIIGIDISILPTSFTPENIQWVH